MRPTRLAPVLLAAAAFVAGCAAAPERVLDIYWIDVEGGASTLVVTADGQSLLMDTGYDGFDNRDPDRIEAVARDEAGLDRIDYLLTSHFHGDHVGGLAELARRIEVDRFVDHGDSVERESEAGEALFDAYLAVVGDRRRVVGPGDHLTLGDVDVVIASGAGRVLSDPLTAPAPNPLCETFEAHPEDTGENGRSLGYVLRAGDFSFVNLGDLSWNFQAKLGCPANLIGEADIFQVTHHGTRDDVVPAQMWAMAPTVAVSNNGPTKGAGAAAVETVLASPGLQAYWALHRAVNNDEAHNADEPYTANLGGIEDCAGAWIRARLMSDGTYTLTNGRNGFAETYSVR
jgi:competence protein ComEC